MLEGGIDNSDTIFREMAASLDLNVVIQNMNAIYDKNADQLESPDAYEKLDCGFQYCMLLMTLWPALDENQVRKTNKKDSGGIGWMVAIHVYLLVLYI